ncbi:MAG: glycosyltransferase family 2 protein [Bacteroidales bacterium]|nr:glycosyltransferase family 2 protein [Bacteroidales bacterium]
MDLSVVVPAYNEAESLPELAEWIDRVCTGSSIDYEIIIIDDGSSDKTWEVVKRLSDGNGRIRGVRFRRNYGKAAALQTGFGATSGEVVITMDADLQDSPDEIPELVRMVREEGFHIVSGWKKKRYDPFIKRTTSKLYNFTARKFSGIKLHDFNCGLKAYDGEVVRSIEVYGEMHRYIPMLAREAGFRNIGEKVVQHRARKYGVTKYGLDRFLKGYLDMLTISFITRFSKSPMHFFGTLGTLMFLTGFIMAAYLGIRKLVFVWQNLRAPLVTDSPYFYIALAVMIIGSFLFLTGFLAELVNRRAPDRNRYLIKETLNLNRQ